MISAPTVRADGTLRAMGRQRCGPRDVGSAPQSFAPVIRFGQEEPRESIPDMEQTRGAFTTHTVESFIKWIDDAWQRVGIGVPNDRAGLRRATLRASRSSTATSLT